MAKEKVFYLCDGEVENCKKTVCYKIGGDCKHTSNIKHAKNFRKNYPKSSFFECEDTEKIYQELVVIRKELQAIRDSLESQVDKRSFGEKVERWLS